MEPQQIDTGAQIGSFARLPRPLITLCHLRRHYGYGLLSVAPRWLGDQGLEWPPSTSYRHPYSGATTYLIADPDVHLEEVAA
jgi:hypothetical protein